MGPLLRRVGLKSVSVFCRTFMYLNYNYDRLSLLSFQAIIIIAKVQFSYGYAYQKQERHYFSFIDYAKMLLI